MLRSSLVAVVGTSILAVALIGFRLSQGGLDYSAYAHIVGLNGNTVIGPSTFMNPQDTHLEINMKQDAGGTWCNPVDDGYAAPAEVVVGSSVQGGHLSDHRTLSAWWVPVQPELQHPVEPVRSGDRWVLTRTRTLTPTLAPQSSTAPSPPLTAWAPAGTATSVVAPPRRRHHRLGVPPVQHRNGHTRLAVRQRRLGAHRGRDVQCPGSGYRHPVPVERLRHYVASKGPTHYL